MLNYGTYFSFSESTVEVTLQDVLVFFTGCDCKPTGFYNQIPKLTFLRGSNDTLATATTCELNLRLPVCYTDYDQFKERMTLSFKGHGGFGLIDTNDTYHVFSITKHH